MDFQEILMELLPGKMEKVTCFQKINIGDLQTEIAILATQNQFQKGFQEFLTLLMQPLFGRAMGWFIFSKMGTIIGKIDHYTLFS